MRGLVERVTVRPSARGVEVELVGEIAKIMKLSGDRRAWTRSLPESVKLVAGTRSSLALRGGERRSDAGRLTIDYGKQVKLVAGAHPGLNLLFEAKDILRKGGPSLSL